MKLALEIPIRHWYDFIDYEDFHYTLVHLVNTHQEYRHRYQSLKDDKDLWLDNSFNELRETVSIGEILKGIEAIGPTHVVVMEAFDPKRNLVLAELTKTELVKRGLGSLKTVACWRGTQWEMKTLKQIVDIVALPYDSNRNYGLSISNAKDHHFFGFRNFDEVRKWKPLSLDTSAPIRAAAMGIDLRERSRRPKNLIPFDPWMELTPQQVFLAQTQILSLKAAGND